GPGRVTNRENLDTERVELGPSLEIAVMDDLLGLGSRVRRRGEDELGANPRNLRENGLVPVEARLAKLGADLWSGRERATALGRRDQAPTAVLGHCLERRLPMRRVTSAQEHDRHGAVGVTELAVLRYRVVSRDMAPQVVDIGAVRLRDREVGDRRCREALGLVRPALRDRGGTRVLLITHGDDWT